MHFLNSPPFCFLLVFQSIFIALCSANHSIFTCALQHQYCLTFRTFLGEGSLPLPPSFHGGLMPTLGEQVGSLDPTALFDLLW